MKISAKIIADTIGNMGNIFCSRLTTFEITYPRTILCEVNTHLVLSKNTASSRAIPVKKRSQSVIDNPALPVWIGENQPGMQASKTSPNAEAAKTLLIENSIQQADLAYKLDQLNIHKQIANRVMEPYTWVTQVITGTNWMNFFAQRCSEAADPTFDVLAGLMLIEFINSVPSFSNGNKGEIVLHAPYAPKEIDIKFDLNPEAQKLLIDFSPKYLLHGSADCIGSIPCPLKSNQQQEECLEMLARMLYSAAACARVSYEKHATDPDPSDQIKFVIEKVIAPGHWSPTQHQGIEPIHMTTDIESVLNTECPDTEQVLLDIAYSIGEGPILKNAYWGNFRNWRQFRKLFREENMDSRQYEENYKFMSKSKFLEHKLKLFSNRCKERGIDLFDYNK